MSINLNKVGAISALGSLVCFAIAYKSKSTTFKQIMFFVGGSAVGISSTALAFSYFTPNKNGKNNSELAKTDNQKNIERQLRQANVVNSNNLDLSNKSEMDLSN